MINKFLVGTDPEFIIVDSTTLEPKSGVGIVGGSKAHPEDIGNGCGVQEDNVTAELTVPPASSAEEFVGFIMYGKNAINERLKPYNLKLLSASSARYSAKELDSDTARKFGCEPSYCIYTRRVSPRPTPEQIGNLRSAGFHIHVGADRLLTADEIEKLIFFMDIYLGLPSVIIDMDTDRKSIYGNAGDFRFKHITKDNPFTIVEYRTLGAALHGSEEHIRYFYNQTCLAVEAFNKEGRSFDEIINTEVRNAIDKNDQQLASRLLESYGVSISVPRIFEEGTIYYTELSEVGNHIN